MPFSSWSGFWRSVIRRQAGCGLRKGRARATDPPARLRVRAPGFGPLRRMSVAGLLALRFVYCRLGRRFGIKAEMQNDSARHGLVVQTAGAKRHPVRGVSRQFHQIFIKASTRVTRPHALMLAFRSMHMLHVTLGVVYLGIVALRRYFIPIGLPPGSARQPAPCSTTALTFFCSPPLFARSSCGSTQKFSITRQTWK